MASDDRVLTVIGEIKGNRSINQFARDLGVDPGQLWRVLKGEQGANTVIVRLLRVYPERATEIAQALADQPVAVAQ